MRNNSVSLISRYVLALLLAMSSVAYVSSIQIRQAPSRVEAAEEQEPEHAHGFLIADTKAVAAGKKFRLGVELKMDPQWHTYYRESGDAGMPTRITWELPPGFKASDLMWEKPHKLVDAGITTYGHNNRTVISADIQTPANLKAGEKLNFKAKVKWLVCKDACIPGGAELELTLPVAASPAEAVAANEDKFKNVNFNGPASEIKADGADASSGQKKK